MTLPIVCPHDRQPLMETLTGFSCGACAREYQVRDNVVCTLDHPDEFYEGAYENQIRFLPKGERAWQIWPLWLVNSGYLWFVRRYVPEGSVVLELGCAGGVRYFGKRYRMVGCDLSFSSLRKLEFYERMVQADASECIPLPDSSVDAVVSSYFWEHIPPSVKPKILEECRRILKPGGKLVFLYDVETDNPLIRRYKDADKRLYEKLFIEGDGHLGYQQSKENLSIFEKSGFHVLAHKGMEKTWLQGSSVYIKLGQFDGSLRRLFACASRLGEYPAYYPYTAILRLIDMMICPWLPEEWARIDLVICEKTPLVLY